MTATSRVQALERLTQDGGRPDALLVDYHLDHDLTGFDAIYGVRKYLKADIPAAVITADRSDEVRSLLGAKYLPALNNPANPNRLRALLTSLLATGPFGRAPLFEFRL